MQNFCQYLKFESCCNLNLFATKFANLRVTGLALPVFFQSNSLVESCCVDRLVGPSLQKYGILFFVNF